MLTTLSTMASLAAVSAGAYLGPHVLRWSGERVLRQRCRAKRTLVLTYDDGPGSDLTGKLLDLLAARGARATFFLLGCRAEQNRAMVERLTDSGHELGCHSQWH